MFQSGKLNFLPALDGLGDVVHVDLSLALEEEQVSSTQECSGSFQRFTLLRILFVYTIVDDYANRFEVVIDCVALKDYICVARTLNDFGR